MKILFNGNLIDEPIPWSSRDRAFQYGDGFFETMLFSGDSLPLLRYHRERIAKAAELYRLSIPQREFDYIDENVRTLIELNNLSADLYKVKLMIWRRADDARGYRSMEHRINWVLVVTPLQRPILRSGISIGISAKVQIPVLPWSGVKSMNALPYVLAGFECQERALDDLILLNTQGAIAEGIESNIFWYRENTWQTPQLRSGCVAGTMRAALLDHFNASGIAVIEADPTGADFIPNKAFTCNGLASIGKWNGTVIEECHDFLGECLLGLNLGQ